VKETDMQTSNEKAVKVLNGLIETTLDSANGYREAAENTDRADFKSMFAERSAKREALASRLQTEVRTFGGEPETDQSMMGKAHNKFVDLKNAMTGGSDKAVVDEVERGEDFIKQKFETAAQEDDLPVEVRGVIERACQEIRADHDMVSALKHQLH
jgi:uncharacterized protein (TIGR02284 family)